MPNVAIQLAKVREGSNAGAPKFNKAEVGWPGLFACASPCASSAFDGFFVSTEGNVAKRRSSKLQSQQTA